MNPNAGGLALPQDKRYPALEKGSYVPDLRRLLRIKCPVLYYMS